MTGGHPILCVQGCVSPCREKTEAEFNIIHNMEFILLISKCFGLDYQPNQSLWVMGCKYYTKYKCLVIVGCCDNSLFEHIFSNHMEMKI